MTKQTTLTTKKSKTKIKRPTAPKVGTLVFPKPESATKFTVDTPDHVDLEVTFDDIDAAVMRAALHSVDMESPALIYQSTAGSLRRRLCMVVEVTSVGAFMPVGGGL